MSELYRHLLIPKDAVLVPERYQVAAFFDELGALGALPKDTQFMVVTNSGKTRAIARNPNTGEVYYGPDLTIRRFADAQRAIHSMDGKEINELWAEGNGPATISPFDLYRAHQPGVLWRGSYSFTVRCKLRQEKTHFLHSAFGCKCELKPNEPATFENPWNNQPIETSGHAFARFWIEFGIGDWLMPMITNSLEILDSRLVNLANSVFSVEFTQGCLSSDD
jgi:hypothetical protein